MDNSSFQLKKCECELCGQIFENKNPKSSLIKHQIWCSDKYKFLNTYGLNSDNLEEKYNISGSVLQFQRDYPFRTNNAFYYKILKELKIETSIKKASNSKSCKDKRKATNIEKYGFEHNFCKDHPSRIKWESRLLEEEGINNVFQREEVKQKSIQTLIEKYGVEHIAQNEDYKVNLQYYIRKFGDIDGPKKYEELCFEKGKAGRLDYYVNLFGEDEGLLKYQERIKKIHNSDVKKRSSISNLSVIFAKILEDLNIIYEQEFIIQEGLYVRIYDFKINETLIELNGDFWHANPNKYNSDDILKFPGGDVTAKNIWEKDEFKKQLAINNGYNIIYFWEKELKNKETLNKIKQNINELFKNKIN